jgi:pimeloyl-ACP methyl ester carboxylesterase
MVVDVDGIPMSALINDVPHPRAVIVALHGGGSNASYFDAPGRLSLLAVGAALGFTVIALDRPGYGSSEPHAAELADPARRVELSFAAVDRLLVGKPTGAGYFLFAHSMGCVLAIRMANTLRGADLLGLELSGTGLRHHPRAVELMADWAVTALRPGALPPGLRQVIWGPEQLYPTDGAPLPASPSPAYEGLESDAWPAAFPEQAAGVQVPVRYCLGDQEGWWRPGPGSLAEVGALFAASPRVVIHEQIQGGHNLSRGFSAAAYHLSALAFVEECVLAREHERRPANPPRSSTPTPGRARHAALHSR